MCVGELKSNYNFKLKRRKKIVLDFEDWRKTIQFLFYCSFIFNLRFNFWKFFLLINSICSEGNIYLLNCHSTLKYLKNCLLVSYFGGYKRGCLKSSNFKLRFMNQWKYTSLQFIIFEVLQFYIYSSCVKTCQYIMVGKVKVGKVRLEYIISSVVNGSL